MGRISEIAKDWKKDAETKELPLKNGQSLDIYVLEKIDWAAIKKRTGEDVWSTLLEVFDIYEDLSEEEFENLTDEEKQRRQQRAGKKFMRKLGFEMQLEMWLQSLRKEDPDATREDVSHLLAHQVASHISEMEYLQFMIGGISRGEVEQEVESGDDEKKSKPLPNMESTKEDSEGETE